MEKTYSQKIANVFSIVGYILLVPTILVLLYPAMIIIGAIFTLRLEVLTFSLIPFIIPAYGVALLIGYGKHIDGKLSEKQISRLWLGTAVYNFVLLCPWLLASAAALEAPRGIADSGNLTGFLASMSVVFLYLAAIYFALKAYSFEKQKNLV